MSLRITALAIMLAHAVAASAALGPLADRTPATQNKLDDAGSPGEGESDTARLEDAVTAYRAALLKFTRKRTPLDWAATQNNLGDALRILGERKNDTTRLDEAVTAYRAALMEFTRKRVPLQWAMTQNNLGAALWLLGERESDTAQLEDAVTAWDACLTVASSVWPPEWVRSVSTHRDQVQKEIMRRAGK
jgi:tetratricopeptide (TPR) repeat protein